MKFTQILKDVIWLLLTEKRVSYRRLKIEFDLDDGSLEEIRFELSIRSPGTVWIDDVRIEPVVGDD